MIKITWNSLPNRPQYLLQSNFINKFQSDEKLNRTSHCISHIQITTLINTIRLVLQFFPTIPAIISSSEPPELQLNQKKINQRTKPNSKSRHFSRQITSISTDPWKWEKVGERNLAGEFSYAPEMRRREKVEENNRSSCSRRWTERMLEVFRSWCEWIWSETYRGEAHHICYPAQF